MMDLLLFVQVEFAKSYPDESALLFAIEPAGASGYPVLPPVTWFNVRVGDVLRMVVSEIANYSWSARQDGVIVLKPSGK